MLDNKQKENVWSEYEKFKKDYEHSLRNNRTPPDIIKDIMTEKKLTIEELQEKSTISKSIINRLRSGVIKNYKGEMCEYFPFLNTIVAFCIACDVDTLMTITLLESYGLSFKRTDEVHYAYCYLIQNCRGRPIAECNEVLEKLKIDKKYHLCNRLI